MKRNFLYTYSLLALLFIAFGASNVLAQNDEIVISPAHGVSDICGFNMTVINKNAAHLTIDQVKLTITALDGSGFNVAAVPNAPSQWTVSIEDNEKVTNYIAVVAPIPVGATQAGFRFAYYNDGSEYDNPMVINWETLNQGNVVSTGTIKPICTTFQSNAKIDTATAITSLNGPDPCFAIRMFNRNSPGYQIFKLRLQLISLTSGTIRPSKVTAPAGWILDSVTPYNAYFHTEQNPINSGESLGDFTVCLRANPAITKHNFVWHAYFDQTEALVDRDTLFNLPGTATSAPDNNDEVSVTPVNGCLYTVTLKNYHVSNLLPPGPITKLVLKMQTPGVHFASAPSAPNKWTKTVTADSVVFMTDSVKYAIPGGIVSSAFRFSATGATTSDYVVGWQTYRPQGAVSTGQFTTKCTVEAPRGDTAFVSPAVDNCSFKLTVQNAHNTPPSDLSDITISIPDGTGQIIGSSSSAVWNFTNVSSTKIKFTNIGTLQTSGQSQDIIFRLVPKTPGQSIDLTWSTFEQGNATAIYSGKVPISCTPVVTVCDTVWKNVTILDSCSYDFSVQNRNTADIVLITFTPDHNWKIDSVGTTPGWTAQLGGGQTTVTFSSDAGIHGGDLLKGFGMKFKACNTTDSFMVAAVTHDRNNNTCTTNIQMFCSAGFCDTAIVHGDLLLDPNGLTNLALMPNPTRTSSQLVFEARSQQRITVTIFDALGRTISTVNNKILAPGSYEFPINLSQQSSGSYYVRIESPYGLVTKRVVKE